MKRSTTLLTLLVLALLQAGSLWAQPVEPEAPPVEPEPEVAPEPVPDPAAAPPDDTDRLEDGREPATVDPVKKPKKKGKKKKSNERPKLWEDFAGLNKAYRVETADYTETVTGYMVNKIQVEIARINSQYNDKYDKIEAREEGRRREAIAVFENFVIRYEKYKVDPRYRAAIADVLFRIAELYREQADYKYSVVKQSFDELLELYQRGKKPSPPLEGSTDYSKALAVFRRLVEEFPEYRYRDMALYLMGFYLRTQEELEQSNRMLLALVDDHPDSEYVVGAYMLIGENYYSMSEFVQAVTAYSKVLTFEENNPYYEDALYRLGWSSFQTFAYPQAIRSFIALLDYYESGKGSADRAASLQKEAIETLANSFVDEDWDGDGTADPDYGVERAFAALNQGKPYERDVLKAFADTLYDVQNTKSWEMAAAAYREYLRRHPLDDLAPEIHDQVIGAFTYLTEEGPAEKRAWYAQQGQIERSSFLKLYGKGSEWARVHQYDVALLKKARTKLETALLERVELLHQKAQEVKEDVGREAARSWYQQAVGAYLAYLEEFPGSQRSLEKRMDLAEAYFFGLDDYDSAAEQYAFLREYSGEQENPFQEQGAFKAIQARQQKVASIADAGGANVPADIYDEKQNALIGKVGELDKKNPGKLIEVEKVPIPEVLKAWFVDAERYLEMGLVHPENVEYVGRLSYIIARVYYRYGHFDEAEKRFNGILVGFPDDKLLAAFVYLDLIRIATIRNDLDKQETVAQAMLNAGIEDADEYIASVQKARLNVRYTRATGALEKADEAIQDPNRVKEARLLYTRSAFELEQMVNENPDFENADLALLGAARSFETVQLYEKAAKLYKRIVDEDRFKESTQRELATYFLATNYKKFFDFERSIRMFQRLGRDYPKSKYRKEALLGAATLQENDQDYVGAAETLKTYLSKFPGGEIEPKLRLLIPRLYERAGQDSPMAAAYRDYLKRYSRNPELVSATMEAALVLGNLARTAGKTRDATRYFTMVRDAFDDNGLQPETDEAARAAEAAFWLMDRRYQNFISKKITTTNYKRQQKEMKSLSTTQKELEKALTEIHVKYKAYGWSVAAFYRIGMLWKHLAMVITDAPLPPNLSIEVEEKYQIEISDFGVKFEDKARSFWRAAVKNAKRRGISNEWTNRILVELNKYPEDRLKYPLFKEEKQVYNEAPLFSDPSFQTAATPPAPVLPEAPPMDDMPPIDGEPATEPAAEPAAGGPSGPNDVGAEAFGPTGEPVAEPVAEPAVEPIAEPPVEPEPPVEGGTNE